MARNCLICSDPSKLRIAAEMVAAGATYRVISERLQVGRMVVYRHAKNHIAAPARAILAAANKGSDVRAERERAVVLAEQGDPASWLSLAEIVSDLRRVHTRLEQQADAAAQENQRLAVASLSSQQLKAQEIRARMSGNIPGYMPQKQGGEGSPVQFSVVFNFQGRGAERIVMTPADHATGPTIDNTPWLPDSSDSASETDEEV